MSRVLCALLLLGCVADGGPDVPEADIARSQWPDPLERAPRGREQRERLCARPGDDLLRDLFCGDDPLEPGSLEELQRALGIDASRIGGHTGIALTANSTALSTRSVSAINPRLIAVRVEVEQIELLALGFVRGEQSVEIAVRDRPSRELRFYFLSYEQACNEREQGCLPEDLLTPNTESDWTRVSLYDEEDLKNTVLDCRACHQPDGPGTPKLLRMQELKTPWTHWMWRSSPGGRLLLGDFFAAHGEESYGAMPPHRIDGSHPGNLSFVVELAGSAEQPNEFPSDTIESEVQSYAAEQHGEASEERAPSVPSATWHAMYERAQRGEAIPVPYHDVRVTDPIKLAEMTVLYQRFHAGELAPGELPDIREVFPDDPTTQAKLGFTTLPGLSGDDVLVQACSQCHNLRLDQSLSRARFHTDLAMLTRSQKDAAIARLRLPATDPGAMPPRRIRYLSDEARDRAIEALRE